MATTPHTTRPSRPASGPVPLAVWPVAQTSAQYQRAGRYHPDSARHPGKMLPALAERIVAEYSTAGQLVVDPMCGTGTTLVEAGLQGRRALGVEIEPAWADLARANLAHARSQGATGEGEVVCGDARHLGAHLDPALKGLVALVLTSPPYGPSVHGQVTTTPQGGIRKANYRYSTDPANLAHVGLDRLVEAMRTVLVQAAGWLRPDGIVAMTVRPWWSAGRLVDLPGAMARAGEQAGLVLYERNIALLAGLRDDHLVPRTSFFALDQARRARARGIPRSVVAHEDLLCFRVE